LANSTPNLDLDKAFTGSLFTSDFLTSAIVSNSDWKALSETEVDQFQAALLKVFKAFPMPENNKKVENESTTEKELIWPILDLLGWTHSLTQQNLSTTGRVDVPDGLLFANEAAKIQALTHAEEWKRYEHGTAIVEAKRWYRPVDCR
jgi:hypothetical protein